MLASSGAGVSIYNIRHGGGGELLSHLFINQKISKETWPHVKGSSPKHMCNKKKKVETFFWGGGAKGKR